eukprot:TRINITY_DN94650_c0_g1_i1.p1 TRINITY_DN94650_c0_g1~~TRINITY_DN94650_c0_g1_i1.p1  ORF type:complete len:222 (+),score=52.74 TRINITY_DN94650_c0_g1_i1:121-786(+)
MADGGAKVEPPVDQAERTSDETSPLVPKKQESIGSLMRQHEVVRSLDYHEKFIGIILAFVAIVALWESIDAAVAFIAKSYKDETVAEAIMFLTIGITGGILTMISIQFAKKKMHGTPEDHLGASTLMALTSLFCLCGTWGFISCCVEAITVEENRVWAWLLIGMAFFLCSMLYSVRTEHYVLLDVVSCVTSLGTFDEHSRPPNFCGGLPDSDDEMMYPSKP